MTRPPAKQHEANGSAHGPGSAYTEHEALLASSDSAPASPDLTPPGSPSQDFFLPGMQRQSSLAQARPDGVRRTSNRVHFAEVNRAISPATELSSVGNVSPGPPHEQSTGGIEMGIRQHEGDDWLELEEEDYLDDDHAAGRGRGDSGDRMARAPLLTGIEAPSVTVATEEFCPEDLLESARPKSGLKSAFMNMANSIM